MGTSSVTAKWVDEVPLLSQDCVILRGLVWVNQTSGGAITSGQDLGLQTPHGAYIAFLSLQLLCSFF